MFCFIEELDNKVRVIQRRAYSLRDEEYLRLKVLTYIPFALNFTRTNPRFDATDDIVRANLDGRHFSECCDKYCFLTCYVFRGQ